MTTVLCDENDLIVTSILNTCIRMAVKGYLYNWSGSCPWYIWTFWSSYWSYTRWRVINQTFTSDLRTWTTSSTVLKFQNFISVNSDILSDWINSQSISFSPHFSRLYLWNLHQQQAMFQMISLMPVLGYICYQHLMSMRIIFSLHF